MWYGAEERTVDSIDKVMDINIFDGRTLQDIWNDVTELEF